MLKGEIAKRFLMFIGALMVFTVGALVSSTSAEARDTVPDLAGLEVVVSGHEGDRDAEADVEALGPTRPPCEQVSHCHIWSQCWRDGDARYCYTKEICHTHCLR